MRGRWEAADATSVAAMKAGAKAEENHHQHRVPNEQTNEDVVKVNTNINTSVENVPAPFASS